MLPLATRQLRNFLPKVIFNNKNAVFFQSLKEAADNYFTGKGIQRTGDTRLYIKTAVLFLVALAFYFFILFFSLPVWAIIGLSCLLGFTLACIGFNVMHDANHGSYASSERVNELLGLTLNALGGNSFIWKFKHNIIHHTYPNVDGMDDDIAKSPFIRMCSTQRWMPAHRVQHIYTPLLYATSSMIWVLFQDFEKYFLHKINTIALAKMTLKDHFIFWISKVFYILFYIALPVWLIGWTNWLWFFISLHVALGLTLAIVFQLAHVVEETTFEFAASDETTRIENEWAIHQVKTTSDFSPNSAVISWLVGGLNYQVEHHLFPRVSHVHYPALSKIVKEKCKEFNLPYNCIPSMRQAVVSHFRLIRLLGKRPPSPSLT
jgi:linoleoyl-CoA desaturase